MSSENPPDPSSQVTATSATVVSSTALGAGSIVLDGRFRILQLLGDGGMGQVFVAEQVSLGRKVALKVLRRDTTLLPEMEERFRREALLLSSIDHPAVVRVIDFGYSNESACLVMELVEGRTLDSVLREGPMAAARAVTLLTQLAEGLSAIHAAGIVHRDLKPENVLVTQTVKGDQARLLDFGIARLAQPTAEEMKTRVGMVLGTPEYMAPEQISGGVLDARTDLYALGVLAFRMLSGALPFPGPEARDYVMQHLREAPASLSTVAPHLDPHLVKAIHSCLEKEPGLRPGSATILASALNNTPVAAPIQLSMVASASAPPPLANAVRLAHGLGARIRRAAAAFPVSRRTVRVGGAAAAAVLGLCLFLLIRSAWTSPERRAASQLRDGDWSGVLLTVQAAKAERDLTPELVTSQALALHQLKRHAEEWRAMANVPAGDLETVGEEAVSSLLEDFAKSEREPALREQLNRLSRSHVQHILRLALTGTSLSEWGALRYLDHARIAEVDFVQGYVAALEGPDCPRRAMGALRLGDFVDPRAIAPLERVKANPTEKRGESCGQKEAATALRKIQKR